MKWIFLFLFLEHGVKYRSVPILSQKYVRSFSQDSIEAAEPPLQPIDGVEQFPDHINALVDEIMKLNLMESNELARCLQVVDYMHSKLCSL